MLATLCSKPAATNAEMGKTIATALSTTLRPASAIHIARHIRILHSTPLKNAVQKESASVGKHSQHNHGQQRQARLGDADTLHTLSDFLREKESNPKISGIVVLTRGSEACILLPSGPACSNHLVNHCTLGSTSPISFNLRWLVRDQGHHRYMKETPGCIISPMFIDIRFTEYRFAL